MAAPSVVFSLDNLPSYQTRDRYPLRTGWQLVTSDAWKSKMVRVRVEKMKLSDIIHRTARVLVAPFVLAGLVIAVASPGYAQDPQQESSSKPPDAAGPASAKNSDKPAKPKTDSATKNAPDQPKWDPLRAENDIGVGQHYMHKGDYDAAIDRFQDAIDSKPGYAIPFRYLGEAQEKKGLKKQAIKSYQRYLDLYPHAEDAAKIKKRIEKLYKEVEKEKKG
jgi:tetratricopeptide (TPR) repeat protein